MSMKGQSNNHGPWGFLTPNLTYWRRQRVMSQTEVAELAGLSKAFVCRLEKGQKRASARNIGRIAQVLDCTREQLVNANATPKAA